MKSNAKAWISVILVIAVLVISSGAQELSLGSGHNESYAEGVGHIAEGVGLLIAAILIFVLYRYIPTIKDEDE